MRRSTPLQIRHLKELFTRLNPDIDPLMVDFDALVGSHEIYAETLEDAKREYPQYRWVDEPDYGKTIVDAADADVRQYGYRVVSSRELARLRSEAEKPPQIVEQAPKPEATPSGGGFTRILSGLKEKPLLIVASPQWGKTVVAKRLVDMLKVSQGINVSVRVFDPSLRWWAGSPMMFRQYIDDSALASGGWRNLSDCVYELGGLNSDSRKAFISTIIGAEYRARYLKVKDDSSNLDRLVFDVAIIEEAQSTLERLGGLSTAIRDWVSIGANLRMRGILITHRPAELDTKLVERCNLLIGGVDGDRNRLKLRGASSRDFMDRVAALKPHEFAYWDGAAHRVPIVEPGTYPEPLLYRKPLSKV